MAKGMMKRKKGLMKGKSKAKPKSRRDVTKVMGANKNTRRLMKKIGYTD